MCLFLWIQSLLCKVYQSTLIVYAYTIPPPCTQPSFIAQNIHYTHIQIMTGIPAAVKTANRQKYKDLSSNVSIFVFILKFISPKYFHYKYNKSQKNLKFNLDDSSRLAITLPHSTTLLLNLFYFPLLSHSFITSP